MELFVYTKNKFLTLFSPCLPPEAAAEAAYS